MTSIFKEIKLTQNEPLKTTHLWLILERSPIKPCTTAITRIQRLLTFMMVVQRRINFYFRDDHLLTLCLHCNKTIIGRNIPEIGLRSQIIECKVTRAMIGRWRKRCVFCTQLGHCPSFILATRRTYQRRPKRCLLPCSDG